jgi:hypothetical protein
MEPIDLTSISGGSIQSGTYIHTSPGQKLVLNSQQKLQKTNSELVRLFKLVSSEVTDFDEFPHLQSILKSEIIPFAKTQPSDREAPLSAQQLIGRN